MPRSFHHRNGKAVVDGDALRQEGSVLRVDAVKINAPFGGFQQTDDAFDQGAFSRAVGADHGGQAAFGEAAADMMHGGMTFIRHCQIADGNQGRRRRHHIHSSAQATASQRPAPSAAATASLTPTPQTKGPDAEWVW